MKTQRRSQCMNNRKSHNISPVLQERLDANCGPSCIGRRLTKDSVVTLSPNDPPDRRQSYQTLHSRHNIGIARYLFPQTPDIPRIYFTHLCAPLHNMRYVTKTHSRKRWSQFFGNTTQKIALFIHRAPSTDQCICCK